MAVWSRFVFSANQKFLRPVVNKFQLSNKELIKRCMSDHKTITISPSRWQWTKTRDLMHFYFMLGAIPLGITVMLANIFVGPATLSEIPEGYIPKHYEYYRSPITRFLAKYITLDPQEQYERYLHYLYLQELKMKINKLQSQIEDCMIERSDHMYAFYKHIFAMNEIESIRKHLKEEREAKL